MKTLLLAFAATTTIALAASRAHAAPVCGDVNTSGEVTTSDALAVLRNSVGQDIILQCEDCAAGTTYGNPTDFVGSEQRFAGFLQGSMHEIPVPSTVTHLGIIGKSSGQHVRMALYTDSGGEPEDLVVGTGAFTLVEGAQQIRVPATLVPAGNYWIMITHDNMVLIGTDQTDPDTTIFQYRTLAFGSPFPDQFGPATSYLGKRQNLYVQVAPVIP